MRPALPGGAPSSSRRSRGRSHRDVSASGHQVSCIRSYWTNCLVRSADLRTVATTGPGTYGLVAFAELAPRRIARLRHMGNPVETGLCQPPLELIAVVIVAKTSCRPRRSVSVRTMNVSLPAEFVEFVEGEARAGEYMSASEVVRAARRGLRREKAPRE